MTYSSIFGNFIKEQRLLHGLTQEEVGLFINNGGNKLAKVDAVTVSRWERGVTSPSNSKQVEVAALFNYDWFKYLLTNAAAKFKVKVKVDNKIPTKNIFQDSYYIESAEYKINQLDSSTLFENNEFKKLLRLLYIKGDITTQTSHNNALITETLKRAAKSGSLYFISVHSDYNQLAGHIIALRVSNKIKKAFIKEGLLFSQLLHQASSQKIKKAQNHIIISTYTGNANCFQVLFGHYFKEFLLENDLSECSSISCLTKDSKLQAVLIKFGFQPKTRTTDGFYICTISHLEILKSPVLFSLAYNHRSNNT